MSTVEGKKQEKRRALLGKWHKAVGRSCDWAEH